MAVDDLMQVDSLLAQQSVVGAMLIDDRCIGAVLSALTAEDFTDGTCRNTFLAIKNLFTAGKPADPVTVVDAVSGGDVFVRWVREVMDLTPTAANVEYYAGIVKRQTALLRLKEQADRLSLTTDLEEARKIVQSMASLTTDASRVERMTAAELAGDFIRRMTSKEKPEYLPWGIPSADRIVYAERGDFCLLGGYPSAGKTLLSLQMALTQAKRYKVGYYTLETRPEKMADRMFAHLANLSLEKIKKRSFTEGDLSRAAEAAALFTSTCPIDFIRGAGLSVDDIAADAVSKGYEIIYIDYLQLVEAPGIRPGDRYAAVTAVSRGLKIFGQQTNTTVVALAQLSRPEKTGKKGEEQKFVPPSMQSFRESGQIEQDADVAFLLWPEDPNDNQSQRTFKLGKNKEGRKFSVSLAFHGATQTMTELEPKPDTSVAAQMSAVGRAARQASRANSGQVQFREIAGGDKDNPFA